MIREYDAHPLFYVDVDTSTDVATIKVEDDEVESHLSLQFDYEQVHMLVHQLQRWIAVQDTKKTPGDTGWRI